MTAETIAKALSGHKAGNGWSACCPAHDDRTPSLSLHDSDDGMALVHCHAGCGQDAIGWPADEVAALNAARISGKTDDEIRELVKSLHTKRKDLIAAFGV